MYTQKTKQGYEIIHTITRNNGIVDIIFKRRENDYGIGRSYDSQSGVWDFGHYDYKTAYNALVELIKLNEYINDKYNRMKNIAYEGIVMYEEECYQTCNEKAVHEGVLADFRISEEEYKEIVEDK